MGNNVSHESNKSRINSKRDNDPPKSNNTSEHLTPAQKLAQSETKGMTRSASGADIQESRYGHFVPIEKLAKVIAFYAVVVVVVATFQLFVQLV